MKTIISREMFKGKLARRARMRTRLLLDELSLAGSLESTLR